MSQRRVNIRDITTLCFLASGTIIALGSLVFHERLGTDKFSILIGIGGGTITAAAGLSKGAGPDNDNDGVPDQYEISTDANELNIYKTKSINHIDAPVETSNNNLE